MGTTIRSLGTAPRSLRSVLQLGLAAIGTVLILWSILQFAVVFALMTPSESGFAEGLAIVVFGLYVLVGFVVLAVGLSIPQHERSGIHFSPRQRLLLGYGAVAPVVGVGSIPLGATLAPPLAEPVSSVLVAILVGLFLSGPLATLVAVGSKLRSTLN